MPTSTPIVAKYARMWPREVFDCPAPVGSSRRVLGKTLEILQKPGIYILYRDDVPYYVGRASMLRKRLYRHAFVPKDPYYNFWNFFSAFVVEDQVKRNEIEGILIAAMPTANSAEPRLAREAMPTEITKMMREIRKVRASRSPIPASGLDRRHKLERDAGK
jgi:hypothetical protein